MTTFEGNPTDEDLEPVRPSEALPDDYEDYLAVEFVDPRELHNERHEDTRKACKAAAWVLRNCDAVLDDLDCTAEALENLIQRLEWSARTGQGVEEFY